MASRTNMPVTRRVVRALVRAEYRRSAWAFRSFEGNRSPESMREQERRFFAMARGDEPLLEDDTREACMAWAILYRQARTGRLPSWSTCERWRAAHHRR